MRRVSHGMSARSAAVLTRWQLEEDEDEGRENQDPVTKTFKPLKPS